MKAARSCPTLCDPRDCSLPVSSVHGILQARVLEWVAILSSRGSSRPRDWTQPSCFCLLLVLLPFGLYPTGVWELCICVTASSILLHVSLLLLLLLSRFSRVRLCATPETAAHQALPSLGFSRQERWQGLPFPSPVHESEKWKWSRSVVSNSSRPHGLQPTRLLRPWDFPGKSTGVGCHCLLCHVSLGSPIWELGFP